MSDHSPLRDAFDEESDVVTPKWDSVYLVCKDCRKRKNGPDGGKPKTLGSVIKHTLKDVRPRPRIVYSSCLGLCPKGATAIAYVGRGEPPRMIAVESRGELEDELSSLRSPG